MGPDETLETMLRRSFWTGTIGGFLIGFAVGFFIMLWLATEICMPLWVQP